MAYDGTLKFDTAIDSSGFEKGISGIGSIAQKGLQATGAILTGATTAIVGIGAAAVKVGSDFESAMSKVAAISGATGDDLDALNEKAKEMGATTKFSATESANAFEYMAMAGWKTEDMLNGIEGIMNLAAASGEDLATTSDIVTDALTAFGLTAKDSTHFADVLAQASSNANTNVGLMGETFKYVAPVAGALGFSAEDTATAIGLMANAGIKGSQAGTALRSIFTRLAKPTKEVQIAMNKLGVSLTDNQGNVKSLNELMKDLRNGFADLSEAEAAEMAAMLGGQEAMSGLLAIVNASDDDFNKLTNSIYTCDGAAKRMADTMNDNLQGQITILKSGLEGLGISLYENMQEPLKNVAKVAQEMVGQLQQAFNEGGLDGLVSEVGNVLAQIVQKVAEAIPELINMATSMVQSFFDGIMENLPQIAEAGVQIVTSLATALIENAGLLWSCAAEIFAQLLAGFAEQMPQLIEIAKDALAQFGQALADNAPMIGASATKIILALTSALIENLPQIIETGKEIVRGLIEGISQESPSIGAFLNGFFEEFTGTLGPIVDSVIGVIQKIFDAINSADPATMEAIGKALGTVVAGLIALKAAKTTAGYVGDAVRAIDGIAGATSKAIGALPKLASHFSSLSGAASSLKGALAKVLPGFTNLGKSIASALSKVGTSVSGLFTNLGTLVSGAVAKIGSIISTIGPTIAGIGSVIGGSVMAVTNFFSMLKDGFSWLKETLMVIGVAIAAVGAVILGAPAAVAAVVAGIIAAVATLVVVIKDHWEQIKQFFLNIGTAIADSFKGLPEKIGNVVDTIVTWFQELPGRISEWLTQTIQKITAWGSELWTSATNAAKNFVDGVISFVSELPNKIAYWLGYVITTVIKWGVDLWNWATTEIPKFVEGIVTFISELPGKIWTWLVETVNKVVQWGINLKNTAETYVTNTINSVVKFFSELPGKIWTWLTETITKVIQWGSNLLSSMTTAATNAINAVTNWFSQLPGKIWTWLVDTVNKVKQWAANLLSAASSAAQNAVNKVSEWFQQLPEKVWTWLTNTVSKVTQFASDLAAKASSAAQGFVDNIINGLKGLPDQVKTIGSNIVSGIWEGISSGWDWLVKKVKELADSMLQGAKDALGVESPSKVFALEVGRWIPPGIGEGLDMTMPDLEDQVGGELNGLARKMQTAVDLETGNVTVRSKIKAEHTADTEYPKGGDTYYEENFEQHNEYHVPVASPSEVARANREAARKLLGGVK